MRKKTLAILTAAAIIVLLLSACDLFNPGRFYQSVETFNAVEKPGHGNYWRRLYYTGDNLTSGKNNDQTIIIIGDYAYYYGNNRDKYSDALLNPNTDTFGRVNLITLKSERLPLMQVSSAGSSPYFLDAVRLGEDILVIAQHRTPLESGGWTPSYSLHLYNTASELWENLEPPAGRSSNFTYPEIFNMGNRYFIIIQDKDSGTDYLYEYLNRELVDRGSHDALLHWSSTNIYSHNAYNSDLWATVLSSDLWTNRHYTKALVFDPATDTLAETTLTHDLPDLPENYTKEYSYSFLTASNRFCILWWDPDSNPQGAFNFGSLYLDYVDLDGDRTWKREEYADNPRLGGDEITAQFYKENLYFLFARDWDGSTDLPNKPAELFRINSADLTLENLGALPLSSDESFSYDSLDISESGGFLFININIGLSMIQRPKPYIYNPDGPAGKKWTALPDSKDIFGITWSNGPWGESWREGKYYTGGIDGGPQSIDFCLLQYTPPVF